MITDAGSVAAVGTMGAHDVCVRESELGWEKFDDALWEALGESSCAVRIAYKLLRTRGYVHVYVVGKYARWPWGTKVTFIKSEDALAVCKPKVAMTYWRGVALWD